MTTYDLFLCWIIIVLLVLVVGEASIIKLGVNQIYMAAHSAHRTAAASRNAAASCAPKVCYPFSTHGRHRQ